MTQTAARPKFEFADGMRGVAALAVAVLHATTFTGHLGDADENLTLLSHIADLGNYAVPMFIVLSGYVLMLPAARNGFALRGGFWKYIGRRARRILPPYYAATLLFLMLIAAVPMLRHASDTAWDNKVPVTLPGVISHGFLVHTWNRDWAYQINGPAWSIATEWHIYFIFPLIALPLCRLFGKAGPWIMLIMMLVLGAAVTDIFPSVASARYWLIGCFALGSMAAVFTVRKGRLNHRWFGWSAIAVGSVVVTWTIIDPPQNLNLRLVSDTLAAGAVALGLVSMGRATIAREWNFGRRLFEAKALVNIGLWSFSIYLIHSPLIALANLLLLPLDLPTWLNWVALVFGALPISLVVAYLFFLGVERRFMTSHQKVKRVDRESTR